MTAEGNRYVLVACECFTRWFETYAIRNQEALTVAKVLVNEMFCRFSPLSSYTQIRGDNSRQEICALLQIHKTRTTAYHPHCNDCTLLDMLSTVVKDHPSDRVGPVNTESVFSVKFMFSCIHPFYLMYGCHLMYVPHMKFITLLGVYAYKLCNDLKEACVLARQNGINEDKWQKALYDVKVHR